MKQLGLTQGDLKEALGVSTPAAVCHMLNLRKRIRAEQMAEMCKVLKMSMDELMGLKSEDGQDTHQTPAGRGCDMSIDVDLLERCHVAVERWGVVQQPGRSAYYAVCQLYQIAHTRNIDPEQIVDHHLEGQRIWVRMNKNAQHQEPQLSKSA